MKIGIDFDGSATSFNYPHRGKDIGAVPVLKDLVKNGHKLILCTMRSGKELQDAVDWFKDNGIELHGVNEDPGQSRWTKSPKPFAHLYIDDQALGCPLITNDPDEERPYVDWARVRILLTEMGYLK